MLNKFSLILFLLFSGQWVYAQSVSDIDQLIQKAISSYLAGDITEAKNLLQQAENAATKAEYPRGIGECYLIYGLVAAVDTAPDRLQASIEWYKKSIALARQQGDSSLIARALGNLCMAYYELGNFPESIEAGLNGRSLMLEIIKNPSPDSTLNRKNLERLAAIHLNLANAYGEFGDPVAIKFACEGLAGRLKCRPQNPELVASAHETLGGWYHTFSSIENNFADSAYLALKQALLYFEGAPNYCKAGDLYLKLGAVEKDRNNDSIALQMHNAAAVAFKNCDDDFLKNQGDWDLRFQQAQWLIFQKNKSGAREALQLLRALKQEDPDWFSIQNGERWLGPAFEQMGQMDSAAIYYKLALDLTDEVIKNNQNKFNSTTLHFMKQNAEKELSIEKERANTIEAQKKVLYAGLIIVVLLLLGLVVVFILFRNRSKLKAADQKLALNQALANNQIKFMEGQVMGQNLRLQQIYEALHSHHVPDLILVQRGLEALKGQLPPGLVSIEEFSDLYEQTTKVTSGILTLARELSPDNSTTVHSANSFLIERIKQWTDEVNKLPSPKAIFKHNEIRINERFSNDLQQISMDLLTNAINHAQARNISISIFQNENDLELEVIDDGIGYNPEIPSKGTGTKNLKMKVAHYGGSDPLIGPGPTGKGTRIFVSFPLTTFQ